MKKIVLVTLLVASCVSWANEDGPKESGGGVPLPGAAPCANCVEQESIPGTLSNIDQPPGAKMPRSGSTGPRRDDSSKKSNQEDN